MSYFNRRMTDCFAKLRQKGKQIKTVLSGHKHWTLAVYYILVLFCVSILFVFFCPSFSSPKWRRKNNGMYKYIYAFTPRDTHAHHTHTHIYIYIYICMHTQSHTHTHMHTHMHTHTHTHTHTLSHTHTHTHMHTCNILYFQFPSIWYIIDNF